MDYAHCKLKKLVVVVLSLFAFSIFATPLASASDTL